MPSCRRRRTGCFATLRIHRNQLLLLLHLFLERLESGVPEGILGLVLLAFALLVLAPGHALFARVGSLDLLRMLHGSARCKARRALT